MCSFLVVVLFASEVKIERLSERIANFEEVTFVFRTHGERFDVCFWSLLVVFFLHALNVAVIRLAGMNFPVLWGKDSDPSGGAADLMY